MKIGIAGPVSIRPLAPFLDAPDESFPDGLGGTSVWLLVQGLLTAGFRVSVYTLDRHVSSPQVLSGDHLTIGIGPYRARHRMRDFMRTERAAIYHLIERDAPDIVHAHWTYEFALGALRSGYPMITTVRDWAPAILRLSPDAYRMGRLMMNTAALLKGKHFVANSPYIQNKLQRYLRRSVPVIPNAVDDNSFASPRDRPSSEPVVVSVNNGFGQRKNVSVLLQAFPYLCAEIPRCRLRLIGAGYERGGPADRWARQHGLASRVDFEGPVERESVLEAIRTADLLVHPALEESFGMTLIEAMANGTPVIAGRASGAVPWVTGDGSAGVLTDVTSPRALADASIQLLKDPHSWKRFSEAGYTHAWRNFRLSCVVAQHVAAYESVLHSDAILQAE